MKYLGGKSRISKYLAPFIKEEIHKKEGIFYEPFVGGFNIVPKLLEIGCNIKECYCSDIHNGLINLYLEVLKGWLPPDKIDEWDYIDLKERIGDDPLSVFVSFGCSYAGKEWSSYALDYDLGRNYCLESKNQLINKFKNISKIERMSFSCRDYQSLTDQVYNACIYCDPPYKNTTKYKNKKDFDSHKFYNWCEKIAIQNNCTVLVSEFVNPGWEILWKESRKTNTSLKRNSIKTEYLFKVN